MALDDSRKARAEFIRRSASLRLSVGGAGTIRSSPGTIICGKEGTVCSETVPAGTTVTLTPSPSQDGVFGVWAGACASAGTGPCTLVVEGDVDVLAAFRSTDPDPDEPRLTVVPDGVQVTSDPPGINCPPICEAEFPSGTVVTLRGAALRWNGMCVGSLDTCLVIVDETDGVGTGGPPPPPAPREFGVNVTVTGPGMVSGGNIRCSASQTLLDCRGFYREGSTITLKATPSRKRRFAKWDGFCFGKKRTCTLRVTAPKTVQALFRR